MKLTARSDALKRLFSKAFEAIPAKSPEPAFMNFLLTVKEDSVEVLASDGNITLKSVLPAKDEKGKEIIISAQPGALQVPAKLLTDIFSKIVDAVITLSLADDTTLSITGENTSYTLNTASGKEYPDIDMTFDASASASVTGAQFDSLFQSTSFAVAVRGTKQCFLGINVKAGGGKLAFLATDACRLAQKTVEAPDAPEMTFTVPVKVLSMIDRTEDLKEVKFELGDGKALFQVGNTTYQTRLYNGEFPSPERIRPNATPYTLTVNPEEFVAALDRVTIVTMGDPSSIARLVCSKERVEIVASSQAYGTAKEHLKGAKFNGDLFEISFNVRYVTEAIKALNAKEVTLAFAGEGKLFLVESSDLSNIQIITPIRASM